MLLSILGRILFGSAGLFLPENTFQGSLASCLAPKIPLSQINYLQEIATVCDNLNQVYCLTCHQLSCDTKAEQFDVYMVMILLSFSWPLINEIGPTITKTSSYSDIKTEYLLLYCTSYQPKVTVSWRLGVAQHWAWIHVTSKNFFSRAMVT